MGIRDSDRSLHLMEPLSTQIVQLRLWKLTGEELYCEGLSCLKRTLGYFKRRWTVAGK